MANAELDCCSRQIGDPDGRIEPWPDCDTPVSPTRAEAFVRIRLNYLRIISPSFAFNDYIHQESIDDIRRRAAQCAAYIASDSCGVWGLGVRDGKRELVNRHGMANLRFGCEITEVIFSQLGEEVLGDPSRLSTTLPEIC